MALKAAGLLPGAKAAATAVMPVLTEKAVMHITYAMQSVKIHL